jgi:hypothetical protein
MNLKEMRSKVKQLTGELDSEVITDSLINDFVNEAQVILVDECDLLETFATLSGNTDGSSQRYDLAAGLWLQEGIGLVTSLDVMKIKRVDLEGYKIERIGVDEITDQISTTTKTTGSTFITTNGKLFIASN